MMARTVVLATAAAICCVFASCETGHEERPSELDAVAEAYVRLVLAIGRHDEDYVDAYFGPGRAGGATGKSSRPRNRAAALHGSGPT